MPKGRLYIFYNKKTGGIITKKLNKILLLALCAALLVSASVMGTLAYLTNTTAPVINTFTIGNVSISLDETDVDIYGVKDSENRVMKNTYKLIPGRVYLKDPTIHVNKDSEECWVFIKMSNSLGETAIFEIDKNWKELVQAEDGVVYAYNVKLTEGESSTALFNAFQFAGDADPEAFDGKTITLIGYAVQAEGFDTAAQAWAAGFGTN